MQITCTCPARAICATCQLIYSIVIFLSCYINMPRLVSLAQKFTSSEDPTFIRFYPTGTCCLWRRVLITTMARVHQWLISVKKFSPLPSIDLVHSLDKIIVAGFCAVASGTWHVEPIARQAPQQILPPYGGHRPTKFESYPSNGLACIPG